MIEVDSRFPYYISKEGVCKVIALRNKIDYFKPKFIIKP